MWIDTHDDTAILWIVLFGQVIGAVPVADDPPPTGSYSAWSLDPLSRTFARSSYPAILLGTAAAKLTRAGHNVLMMLEPEPMLYVADGPDGPASIPLETFRAETPRRSARDDSPRDDQAGDSSVAIVELKLWPSKARPPTPDLLTKSCWRGPDWRSNRVFGTSGTHARGRHLVRSRLCIRRWASALTYASRS